jgi:hypothetical protein
LKLKKLDSSKLWILLYLVLLNGFSTLVVKKDHYKTTNITISTEKLLSTQDVIRLYTSKDHGQSLDYKVLTKDYYFSVYNSEIWGFCFPKSNKSKFLGLRLNDSATVGQIQPNECKYKSITKQYHKKVKSNLNFFVRILAIISCMLLLHSLFLLLRYILLTLTNKSFSEYRLELFFGVTSATLMYFWNSITYPTLLDFDITETLKGAGRLHFGTWFSYLNNLSVSILMKMRLTLGGISVLTSFIIWLGLNIYFKFINKLHQNKFNLFFCFLILLNPLIAYSCHFLSRDLYSSLLLTSFGITFIYISIVYAKKEIKINYQLIIFYIIGILASELRREAIIPVLIIFIVFFKYNNFNKSNIMRSIVILFSLKMLSFGLLKIVNPGEDKNTYLKIKVSVSHIISSIIHSEYSSEDHSQDKKDISKFFDFDKMVNLHTEYQVTPFHRGAFINTDNYDLTGLLRLTFRLIKNNPYKFLQSRAKLFLSIVGIGKNSYLFGEHIYKLKKNNDFAHRFNISEFQSYITPRSKLNFEYFNRLHPKHLMTIPVISIFFYTITPIIILFLIVLLFKKLKFSSVVSFAMLLKLPVLFLLAPANQFKYGLDLYLMGYLIIPLAIYEYKILQRQKA